MLPFPHLKEKALADVCTLGIGGPARFFAEVFSVEPLVEMVTYCKEKGLPFFILGKGSNTLFDDRGFGGLVIQNRIDYCEPRKNTFVVGAGFSFARLGGITAKAGWSGLEFASGIPATVGGAIYMNAGANGKETADALQEVSFVTEEGRVVKYPRGQLHFSYRHSSFHAWKGAIVEGTFVLAPSESAKEVQKSLLAYRLKTQPYKDKSAGCAFRNPVGHAAGQLIDACGGKGQCVGEAQVSERHANFIINKGGATAADILRLIAEIKEKVWKEKGIVLEEEIRYIPYA